MAILTNEHARNEAAIRWASYGFARYLSSAPADERYQVGAKFLSGGNNETIVCAESWPAAFSAFDKCSDNPPESWFYSIAAQTWRRKIHELLLIEFDLDSGTFADIDQIWLEEKRDEGYSPQDVIRELVAQHGGGI